MNAQSLVAITAVLLLAVSGACSAKQEAATRKESAMEPTPMNTNDWRKLTPAEEAVIVHKATERPGSGRYEKSKEPGTYVCRRCGAALYRAEDKFDAGCGWPSFDDAVPGAVRCQPDADGQRTELLCATCGAHLGHVFTGERLTAKNTRYCVNSIALDFVPLALSTNRFERAVFAGGCFWGVQALLEEGRGVMRTTAGYTGGHTGHPTYDAVCSHTTGHAEAVEVIFDPRQTTFEAVARLFFEIHDPTQHGRQGPDVGDQYRSAIFYTSEKQKETALRLIGELRKRGLDVATQVTPAVTFWPAEAYHQDYYRKTGGHPYCHRRVDRFDLPAQ
jgi:peptide methionine sulfoxide reductase msrA/msrB